MATTQGSPIQDEDLKSWYTSLNNIISNYGGDIAQLTVPGDNEKAVTAHVNNFFNKMTEMKADEYLGSVTSIYPTYSIVNSGSLIQSNIGTVLASATSDTYLGQIKCRNKATNSNASNQHGANQHTTCGSSTCGSGRCGSSTCGSSTCGSGCSESIRAFFFNGNSNCTSGGYLCRTMNTGSDTFFFFARNSRGCSSQGFCGVCTQSTKSHGTNQHGTNQHGNKQHGTNQHGTNQHGTCGFGTCSSGQVIDILNSHTTKSNTK